MVALRVTSSPAKSSAPSLTASSSPSLDAISADEWDALFPGSPEDWAFHRAVEDTPLAGTAHESITARDADGRLLAAAPVFELDYRLDTPFQGHIKSAIDRISAMKSDLLTLRVLGLGSLRSDDLSLGFAGQLDADGRHRAFLALLSELRSAASRRGANIMAVKSIAEPEPAIASALEADGYGRVTSVPVVMLPLPYDSYGAYLKSLPEKTASYFTRKRRSESKLRIEYRDTTAGIEDQIEALYGATLAQSGVGYGDLDRLPPGFFEALLRRQGERARLMLCWRGEELVSFQVYLVGRDRVVAYKIGMKYPAARELNLYFVNWLRMIEDAIKLRVPEIEMGATSYASKLLFGGHLQRRWLYFRFRRNVSNTLFQPFRGAFDFEKNDPELKRLAAQGPLPGLD